MKKILIILIFLGHCGLARALEKYELTLKSDKNKSFIIYEIKRSGEDIASFCLIDPEKVFRFFSTSSDPDFFKYDIKNHTENHIDSLSNTKKLGPPACVIMADLKKVGLSINFNYFFESLGILIYADPYIKRSSIISSKKINNRYFLETKVNNKSYYCLLVLKDASDEKNASKLIRVIKEFNALEFKLIPIVDFPIKLLSYDNRKVAIYESHKGHAKYSCMFISNKRLP